MWASKESLTTENSIKFQTVEFLTKMGIKKKKTEVPYLEYLSSFLLSR